MKTTLEIPDPLFRRAKAAAALKGTTLKALVNEAIENLLNQESGGAGPDRQGWRRVLGKASPEQLREVDAWILREFEKVDPADWE